MSFTAPTIPLEVYGEANNRLGRVEAEEGVTILFAIESGSRAWGFPSPDSDNDVRFFYVRRLHDYLGLTPQRDVVERPIDGLWDLNGWDLGKALRLLVKGNATVAEWLSSPLIYRQTGPIPYKLRDLIKRHASPQASAKHYYGLTKTCYASEIDRGGKRFDPSSIQVNLKKYFYAIRGACAIAWIARYDEVPPMTLPALMSTNTIPDEVRSIITRLEHQKATMGELGHGPRLPILDKFIEAQIVWVQDQGMDRIPVSDSFVQEANSLLLEALGVA